MDNNNNKATATASGIGFFGLLGVAFIVLRLCGVINWPWVWVLAPIWGSFAIGLIVFILFVIFVLWLSK